MSTDTALPPLYAKWMDQSLGGNIPTEIDADCFDCSRVDRGMADQIPGLNCHHPVSSGNEVPHISSFAGRLQVLSLSRLRLDNDEGRRGFSQEQAGPD